MRTYQCDSCYKIIENPYIVKMKEFYVGMMDIDCISGIVAPVERKRKIKIQLCNDCYKGLHLVAEKRNMKTMSELKNEPNEVIVRDVQEVKHGKW